MLADSNTADVTARGDAAARGDDSDNDNRRGDNIDNSDNDSGGERWGVAVKNRDVYFFVVESVADKTTRSRDGEKIPNHHVWLLDAPAPSESFLKTIDTLHRSLDVAMLWRAANGKSQTLTALAVLAMSIAAGEAADETMVDAAQQLAVLKCALANPIYFYHQNHRLIPRPQEAVEKALAAIAAREQRTREIEALVAALEKGTCPAAIAEQMNEMIHDGANKHSVEYLALKQFLLQQKTKQHGRDERQQMTAYFLQQGLLKTMRDYHQRAFEIRWGISNKDSDINDADYDESQACAQSQLPPQQNAVAAFSIDDEGTIEIDDAFSVQRLDSGAVKIGVHIALPSLWITEAVDSYARARMTSVYFPDAKQTMLPRRLVAASSLALDEYRPALSLYFNFDPHTNEWQVAETVQEQIRLTATLTPTQMEQGDAPAAVCEDFAVLDSFCQTARPSTQFPVADDEANDESANEKSEAQSYYDFKVITEPLQILRRERTAVTVAVETLMRLANQTWSRQIYAAKCGGFYRADGMTKRKPPKNQPPYMWLTSPMRRYVDLQNQRLLLSLLNEQPRFKTQWNELIPRFDRRYHIARAFQQTMERHWALQALAAAQNSELILSGDDLGNGRIRLHAYPLTARYASGDRHPKRADIRLRLVGIDEVTQNVKVARAES